MTEEKVVDRSGHSLSVLNYKGDLLPLFPLESIHRLEHFVFRDDDILISAYPKSGTHWVWEMVRMLKTGQTDGLPLVEKDDYMIELDVTDIATMPSPRILTTHVLFRQLPGLRSSKCKIIFINRNPRDVAVSFYNHHVKLKDYYHYDGSWEDYFHLFLHGQVDYGSWFDYTRDWERVLPENPHVDVLTVFYEDMKENPAAEVTRISQFLGLNHERAFIQSVCDKCDFASMRQRKGKLDATSDGEPIMYRKGEVGDWQNWFTAEQVALMDEVCKSKMANSAFKFRYE
ncbi:sulfotransferase 6B1-like [Littorina saxatilis]|uniref:Sulfotransferase domain-containing protein n=1 Tax=Littorina saxatilis TaxID=31220 RepID=A0AAN9AJE3_9CAEN